MRFALRRTPQLLVLWDNIRARSRLLLSDFGLALENTAHQKGIDANSLGFAGTVLHLGPPSR